jgi:ketosteroid isomerase-like protein
MQDAARFEKGRAPVTSEENKAIAARFYEVYNEGNMELTDKLFSPDFVGRTPTTLPKSAAAPRA